MKKVFKVLKILLYVLVGIIIASVLLYMYTSGRYKVAKTVAQDSTIAHVNLDGVILHTETYGSDTSQVVIVLHGGPGNDFRYLLPLKKLSDQYKMVFYDQRGTGLSPRVDASELTLDSSIEDLDKVIDHFSPGQKVHIIGHSWGAMLGSAYLGRHPDKVNRIILAEPGFLTPEKAQDFMERTNGFSISFTPGNIFAFGKLFMQAIHLRGPDDDAVKDYIFSNMPYLDVKDHPMVGYFCNGKADTISLPFWRSSMTASEAIRKSGMNDQGEFVVSFVEGVEQYQDTVLFISGACNTIIGPDFQKDHMKLFPKSKLVVIEEAGHTMLSEKPVQCQAIIRQFLK